MCILNYNTSVENCQVLWVYLYRIVDIMIIVISSQNINEGLTIKPSSCYTLLGKITIKSTLIPHNIHTN